MAVGAISFGHGAGVVPSVHTRAYKACWLSENGCLVYVFCDVVLNVIGAVRPLSKTFRSIRAGWPEVGGNSRVVVVAVNEYDAVERRTSKVATR